ncbi:MAG: GUN4 domain-containing protein [Scytolyngbya sp. HA4215-MV1]|jgi:hypothetical protein|nr:GUN4 domain-containing protein [Scytolyngbya sp. HA4215-MV1]
MAKIALLIGVSEYGEGLAGLPGTQEDLQRMQRVLQDPQVGGFDAVDVLPNPDRTGMEMAIEQLFSENRTPDDLILLYFSGHGVRDDHGTLYLATRITAKTPQGRIRTSTAVPATALQGYMSQSKSKRQVLILDCCFSGAFAQDMKAKDDAAIDVKTQLGGEGRAVLTSSTATQVSYETAGVSIYTQYLVQGLETGAADRDDDGKITVDELHEYAKEKVQEAAPTMQPEIYAVREGYKILIAHAPQGDPRLVFRKEIDERAKQKRGKFSPVDRRALKFRSQELGLSDAEVEAITQEILQPYRVFWAKLAEFEQAVQETLAEEPQLSATSLEDLQYFQRVLKLRDEDIASVLTTHGIDLTQPPAPPPPTLTPAVKSAPATPVPATLISLASEKGVDYRHLQELLAAGKWKEADQETADQMLKAMGKEKWWDVEKKDLLNFPCQDLQTIDALWVHYSQGRFGFSVQKQIYLDCGAQLDGNYPGDKIWEKFCDRIGWRMNNKYISLDQVTYSTSAPMGHLPSPMGHLPKGNWGGVVGFSSLASRLVDCSIQ